ncbi:hypothetical protein ACLOJK_013623 [Asimina triloba]
MCPIGHRRRGIFGHCLRLHFGLWPLRRLYWAALLGQSPLSSSLSSLLASSTSLVTVASDATRPRLGSLSADACGSAGPSLATVSKADFQPASPSSQHISGSALSLTILGIFEYEIPIDDSAALVLLRDEFLPINPHFSSTLVRDEKGRRRWKRVDVRLKDHMEVPFFPPGLSPKEYDVHLQDYLSIIALEQLPDERPLWEVHVIKYPTSDALGTAVFKLHHALGDGFSLMGALFSCLKRADDPSLPLTFPSSSSSSSSATKAAATKKKKKSCIRLCDKIVAGCWYTVSDFVSSVLHSTSLEDDRTAVRSGVLRVEFEPVSISTVAFSLSRISEIKLKVGTDGQKLRERGRHVEKNGWGNHFTFLPVPIPSNSKDAGKESTPLAYIAKARKTIKRKRNSLAVYLTGMLLETLRKVRGPEPGCMDGCSRYIHSTLKNTSIAISHVVGPMEQMAMAGHPVKGLYFAVLTAPQVNNKDSDHGLYVPKR